MPRTELSIGGTIGTKQSVVVVAGAQDFVFVASDTANGNYFDGTGKEVVFARNDNVGAQTITLTTATDGYGRSGAITTYSLAADDLAWFGPMDVTGWRQTDGTVEIDTSSDDVMIAILTLPRV